MAGVTTSCSIQPFKQPISLSAFQSKLSHLHLDLPNSSISRGCRITCRYGGGGGGGGYSRQGDSRRPKPPADEDPALDISSIRSSTVRLIDEEQNMVGVVSKTAAIQMAKDAELDLVILSPVADPPVVRMMDYNRYKYEQQRKKRDEQRKSSVHRVDQKELKMGYNIDVHDYTVRLKAAQKFLKDGDKVKLIVNLKGRENEFKNNAIELIRRFRDDVGELAIEESKNFRDRNMTLVLIPNKAILQQKETPKKKEKSTGTEISVTASVSP
ncbi:translation initiation factor IF3-2, chloroplastic isoform X1 [Lactuca sativa]|uniref:Translation initiation factor IF-3 n=1 Tax=Lactuca sativa TaxID=4236 RepID=A0A9R1XCW1_LACSA|nr:translation initiation factor IF3-2, chloroplastic isoform X1 [Lactuca sativa]KAJ0208131.1 hypothetical protein LSAT_V11C500261010 [Lactuca sativa]